MTKLAVITTVHHNVGDDFVREGLLYLFEKVLGSIEVALIHKHFPVSVRRELAWLHNCGIDGQIDRLSWGLSRRVSMILDSLPCIAATDQIRRCDILLQSGAPIYWLNSKGDCSRNEWWGPLIEKRWLRQNGHRPFMNLAGGTCQPYDSDGSEFALRSDVLEYVRRFFDMTSLTTLRDKLSLKVLKLAGRKSVVVPCSSIFAVDRFGITPKQGDYTVVNYMYRGGHYDFERKIDAKGWERRFTRFVSRLAKEERCVIVCHDLKELSLAKKLWPDLERFYSPRYVDYLHFYARASYGIVNRVHSAFALASLGKPAAVIGADTRARMAEAIGLEVAFVNDASEEWLDHQRSALRNLKGRFPEQLSQIKTTAEARYLELIRGALSLSSR